MQPELEGVRQGLLARASAPLCPAACTPHRLLAALVEAALGGLWGGREARAMDYTALALPDAVGLARGD